jgi:hypothetical protein
MITRFGVVCLEECINTAGCVARRTREKGGGDGVRGADAKNRYKCLFTSNKQSVTKVKVGFEHNA